MNTVKFGSRRRIYRQPRFSLDQEALRDDEVSAVKSSRQHVIPTDTAVWDIKDKVLDDPNTPHNSCHIEAASTKHRQWIRDVPVMEKKYL